MKVIGEMSIGELAAWVASCLRQHGVEVVLTGGSCVTIYDAIAKNKINLSHLNY